MMHEPKHCSCAFSDPAAPSGGFPPGRIAFLSQTSLWRKALKMWLHFRSPSAAHVLSVAQLHGCPQWHVSLSKELRQAFHWTVCPTLFFVQASLTKQATTRTTAAVVPAAETAKAWNIFADQRATSRQLLSFALLNSCIWLTLLSLIGRSALGAFCWHQWEGVDWNWIVLALQFCLWHTWQLLVLQMFECTHGVASPAMQCHRWCFHVACLEKELACAIKLQIVWHVNQNHLQVRQFFLTRHWSCILVFSSFVVAFDQVHCCWTHSMLWQLCCGNCLLSLVCRQRANDLWNPCQQKKTKCPIHFTMDKAFQPSGLFGHTQTQAVPCEVATPLAARDWQG